MSDREKCEFILKLLNSNEFTLDVRGASSLLSSYKWLYEMNEKMIEDSKKKIEKPKIKRNPIKKDK